MKELNEYATLTNEQLKKGVRKTAKEVCDEIKKNSPKGHGKYNKSWKTKVVSQKSNGLKMAVYSTMGWLPHLLEFGHVTRGGTKRTKAQPHIAPAAQTSEDRLNEIIKGMMK